MPSYAYTALDHRNSILRGQVTAWTKRGARRQLPAHLTVVTLQRVPWSTNWRRLLPARVTAMDRILLTRNWLTMLRAGMNITEALASSREQVTNPTVKTIITNIERGLQSGQPLSSALKRYPGVFSAEYVATVTIGERSGKLVEVLSYLLKKLEDEHRLFRRIRQALTYPAIIVAAMLLVVTVMIVFVIPRVAAIYSDAGAKLPLFTRLLIQVSGFISNYFLALFVGGLMAILLFQLLLQRSWRFRRWCHRFILSIPHFGTVVKKINLATVSRSMSMLLQAGLPIDRSLVLAADAARNVSYRDALRWSEPLVTRGVHLADVFRGQPALFLPVFQRMVATGEKTGNLDTMFANVAQYYDEDLEFWAANISSVIEPAMIIIVAVIVASIAMAVLFPLWNLINVIN